MSHHSWRDCSHYVVGLHNKLVMDLSSHLYQTDQNGKLFLGIKSVPMEKTVSDADLGVLDTVWLDEAGLVKLIDMLTEALCVKRDEWAEKGGE